MLKMVDSALYFQNKHQQINENLNTTISFKNHIISSDRISSKIQKLNNLEFMLNIEKDYFFISNFLNFEGHDFFLYIFLEFKSFIMLWPKTKKT